MGTSFSTILTSSTCCIVHSSALWTGLSTAAMFRNLRLSVGASVESLVLAFSSASLVVKVGEEGLVAMLATALLGLLLMQPFGLLLMQLLSVAATKTCLIIKTM